MTEYIPIPAVVAVHDRLINRLGYPHAALRDEGLLESALMRPQMAAHYEEADLIRQATLLAIGISQAQTFLDGNKRAAYAMCEIFLDLNGLVITGDPIEMAKQLEAVATREDDLNSATTRFEAWLREHVTPR
jgi:death-on-curing protein